MIERLKEATERRAEVDRENEKLTSEIRAANSKTESIMLTQDTDNNKALELAETRITSLEKQVYYRKFLNLTAGLQKLRKLKILPKFVTIFKLNLKTDFYLVGIFLGLSFIATPKSFIFLSPNEDSMFY